MSVAKMRESGYFDQVRQLVFVSQDREMRGTTVELFLTSVGLGSVCKPRINRTCSRN